MKTLKGDAILLGFFAAGLLLVTSGVWALRYPEAFVRMQRWRGLRESDRDSRIGRLKIFVHALLPLIMGISVLIFAGVILYLRLGGR